MTNFLNELKKMKKGLVVIWFLSVGMTSAAQVYQMQAGTILASGRYKGAGVVAVSNHLFMHLNYDNAEMHLRLVIPTLITENDSLNKLLHTLEGTDLAFSGKMNIVFIQTKSHPKQKFSTTGTLTINHIDRPFSFSALLEHFPRGNVSCNFSASFTVNLSEFGIITEPGENMVNVKFTQLVLKRPGEQ